MCLKNYQIKTSNKINKEHKKPQKIKSVQFIRNNLINHNI